MAPPGLDTADPAGKEARGASRLGQEVVLGRSGGRGRLYFSRTLSADVL